VFLILDPRFSPPSIHSSFPFPTRRSALQRQRVQQRGLGWENLHGEASGLRLWGCQLELYFFDKELELYRPDARRWIELRDPMVVKRADASLGSDSDGKSLP
jgi:hypothetical protein